MAASTTFRTPATSVRTASATRISDGAYSDTATVTIEVTNAAPDAVDDGVYTVHHGQTLTVPAATGALANDSDPDGDTLTAVLDSVPQFGALSFQEDGSFDYIPYAGYVGSDSFSYTISDGAYSDTATITIEVTNTAPDAVDDGVYTVHHGQILTVPAATGALANDSDPDGDTLTAVLDSVPQFGSLSFQEDGSFDYIPYAGYVGSDSFSYTISDGAFSDPATIKPSRSPTLPPTPSTMASTPCTTARP
jgi:hypothetical protein